MGPHDEDAAKKQPWQFTSKDGASIMLAAGRVHFNTTDLGPVESSTLMTQPAGAPLNGCNDGAPVVLFGEERKRWLELDGDFADLLGLESRDRFEVVKCGIR